MNPITHGGPQPAADDRARQHRSVVPGDAVDADPRAAAPLRFLLGDWQVESAGRRLQRGEASLTLEPRPMAVLLALCAQPGAVVSADALLQACWPDAVTGDNPVHKVVAGLRRALGDSATEPRYIETIRKQGYRLLAPIEILSEQGPRSQTNGWRGQSPFRGLDAFDARHASVFFGRDAAVQALHERLTQQWAAGQALVVLLGPSGSGKTSLVQAGLIPALMQAAQDGASERLRACAAATVDLAALGDLDPWAGLAGAMLDWDCRDVPLLSGHSIDSLAHALRDHLDGVMGQLDAGLAAVRVLSGGTRPAPPLLVLDRLEALFQAPAQRHAEDFLSTVEALVDSGRLMVLAVCRNDFYPSLARQPVLMRGKARGAHLDLLPPEPDAIAQMIRLPARAAGLVFAADASGLNRLDDRLFVDALQAADALPLLQYALQELYLNRAPGDVLTWEAYEALGGLEGAIGSRAEAVLGRLSEPRQQALLRLLPRLVGLTQDDAGPTSRWVAAAELADDDERALAMAFVEARLLVADHAGGSAGYRVAHEALLRRWPRVTAWVAQHRVTLATRDELRPWAQRWMSGARDGALLLPLGATLWQAARARTESPELFSADERDFIDASQRQVSRRRLWRGAAMAGALLLAIGAGLAATAYARQAQLAAERERQSRQLASFMLGELADGLRPIGKLDLLRSIGDQGLRLLGQAEAAGGSAADALQRAKALVVIGEVNSSRGQGRTDIAVDALAAARSQLEALEPLDQRAPDVAIGEFYKTLGAASFWLGQMAYDGGELETAANEMGRYRETSLRWMALQPGDAGAKVELAYAINSLGSIAFRRGAWPEADRWFGEALALKLEALAQRPADADAREAVAGSRTWLGMVAHVRGQPNKALGLYEAARSELNAVLAAHAGDHVRMRDLGALEQRTGEAMAALGRRADAVRMIEQGVTRMRTADLNDPSNRFWRADRLHGEAQLLLFRVEAGLPVTDAMGALRDQAAAATAAPANASTSNFLRLATVARFKAVQAALAAREGDLEAASRHLADVQPDIDGLVRERPRHWQVRELQARLVLLALSTRPHRAASDARQCALWRDQIQPAVNAGQSGLVLEAWLAARACAGPAAAEDGGWRQRLTADGYVPVHAALLQPRP
ncbi:MAG: winged helix-turn-helix domain-containing protein [Burkholderiaceae bacterium]